MKLLEAVLSSDLFKPVSRKEITTRNKEKRNRKETEDLAHMKEFSEDDKAGAADIKNGSFELGRDRDRITIVTSHSSEDDDFKAYRIGLMNHNPIVFMFYPKKEDIIKLLKDATKRFPNHTLVGLVHEVFGISKWYAKHDQNTKIINRYLKSININLEQ